MVRTQAASSPRSAAAGLDDLLVEARRDSAEFPDVLANHAPMILVALARLGADETRLREFFDDYRARNRLVPSPPKVDSVDRDTWRDCLSDRARESDARLFFEREVALRGIKDACAGALPVLLPGIAGSALHPLMRLAYGVLRRDPAEVGTALGYWTACALPLPRATGAPPNTNDPGEILARVAAMPGLRALPAFDHLWHGIRAAAAIADFAPVVDWLAIDGESLGRLAATSLALFAATMDFAALHAVTGTHWVRIVAQVYPDPLLPRYFWQAVAALVPAIGFPALPEPDAVETWRRLPCPDWPQIKAKAITSNDEHDISLVFSANEEEKIYGDRLYRVVAARRLGLIA